MWGIECLLLIPFIIRFNKLDNSGRWIFYFLISSIVFSTGTKVIAEIWGNNLWFWHSMYYVQFVILSLYFRESIKHKTIKFITIVMVLPVLGFVLLDYYKLEGPNTFNSYSVAAETFILIIYGALYFWQLLRDEELVQQSIFINSLPDFWYNAGIFIYHCGFFLFSLAYNILKLTFTIKGDSALLTLAITFGAGIIQMVLLFIGISKVKKSRT